jgi:choline monooxygenase
MSAREAPVEILQRVDQPIAQATGLPNQQYTDPDSFKADRDAVIAPAWACIAFQDELPHPNSVLPVDFMGLPLVITRDNSDRFRVFHNVCSHRGMQLAAGPCRQANNLRCPYHSWTYDLNGELIGTPHLGGYGIHEHPAFDRAANGLQQVRSTAWLGAIFVNLSADAPPFDDAIAPIRQGWSRYLPDDVLSGLVHPEPGGDFQLTVQSNWKLAVENYLECYHLPTVHPELNRVSPLRQHEQLDPFDNGGGQRCQTYRKSDAGGKQIPSHPAWSPQHAASAEYPVLYPNTLFGIHADHAFILFLRPEGHDCPVESGRIFYLHPDANEPACERNRQAVLNGWKTVFEEDVDVVEALQAGRASPAFRGGAFSPVMDRPTHHFHQWVARKMAAAKT